MASGFPMKIIKFSFATESFRYKFPYDTPFSTIDNRIRYEFKLPKNIYNYSLIDSRDNTIIEISSLRHIEDESNVFVKIRDDQSSNIKSSTYVE
jgi:hypothetical protein